MIDVILESNNKLIENTNNRSTHLKAEVKAIRKTDLASP